MLQGDDAHPLAPASVDHGHRDEFRRQLVVKQRRTLDEFQHPVRLVEDDRIAHPGGILTHHDVHAVVDKRPVVLDV